MVELANRKRDPSCLQFNLKESNEANPAKHGRWHDDSCGRTLQAVLCQTTRSLMSLGTEKLLIEFGKSGWLAKARSQLDNVKQVLQKIRTDEFWTALDKVKANLDTPIPLGYCHVCRVLDADPESRFSTGDRMISNGPHDEIVSVSEDLVTRIPDNVTDETAAFTVVAAIGLQGIRLEQPALGERFVVSGSGLNRDYRKR